jgi:tetratricopeptide (TPR) repeat protein
MKKLLIIFALVACILSCSNPQHHLLISNVNVIDVVTGEVLPNRTVAIDGDSITAIYTKTIKPGKQTEVVDGTGKYLIPGLWDMHGHYHWYPQENDLLMIPNGVLGVRDPWGDPQQAKRLREEHQKGTYMGVDIYTSGSLIDGKPSYWGSAEVGTPEEARDMVNCQIEQGVDFVKPYSELKKEVYLALMDEARQKGVTAAGHVPFSVTLEEAVDAGHRIDDHIYGMESLFYTREQFDEIYQLFESRKYNEFQTLLIKYRDSSIAFKNLEKLKDQDIWFCPTYVTLKGVLRMYKEEMKADPRNEYVPVVLKYHGMNYSIKDSWAEDIVFNTSRPDSIQFEMDKAEVIKNEEQIKMLIKSGAKVIAGTDYIIPYIYPGFSLQEEMQTFVRLGMTPLQALQTATINPAQAMKNDKVGEIKVGKRANVVLLNANPLEDIHNTQDIYAVVLRGKHLDRAYLDGMIDKAKQLAKAKHIHEWFAPRFEADGMEATIQTFLENKESIDEEYPVRWNMLQSAARMFLRDEKKDEAFALVELMHNLYPDFVYAFAFTGDIYAKAGDKEKARATYEKALKIYPCFNVVERWIKELDEPVAFGQKYKSNEPEILGARIPCMYHNH